MVSFCRMVRIPCDIFVAIGLVGVLRLALVRSLRMTGFFVGCGLFSRRVQRSFVGRPSLRAGLRFLRMTIFLGRIRLIGCGRI